MLQGKDKVQEFESGEMKKEEIKEEDEEKEMRLKYRILEIRSEFLLICSYFITKERKWINWTWKRIKLM